MTLPIGLVFVMAAVLVATVWWSLAERDRLTRRLQMRDADCRGLMARLAAAGRDCDRCPDCHAPLAAAADVCSCGHRRPF